MSSVKSVMYASLISDEIETLPEVNIKDDIVDLVTEVDTVTTTVDTQISDDTPAENVVEEALEKYDQTKEKEENAPMFGGMKAFAQNLAKSVARADLILATKVQPTVTKLMEECENESVVIAKEDNIVMNDVDPIIEGNTDIFDWEAHIHSEIAEEVWQSVIADRLANSQYSDNLTTWMNLENSKFTWGKYEIPQDIKEAYTAKAEELQICPNATARVLDQLGLPIYTKLNQCFVEANINKNYLQALYLADEITDDYHAASMLKDVVIDTDDDLLTEIRTRLGEYTDMCILAMCAICTLRNILKDSVILMIRDSGHYTFNPDTLHALEEKGWTQADVCKFTYINYRGKQLPAKGIVLDDLVDVDEVNNAYAQLRTEEAKQQDNMRIRILRQAIVNSYPRILKASDMFDETTEFTPEEDAAINQEAEAVATNVELTEDYNLESLTYKFVINLCYPNTLVDKIHHTLEEEMGDALAEGIADDMSEDDLQVMKTGVLAKVVSDILVDKYLDIK